MRTMHNRLLSVARQTGGFAAVPSLNMNLNLLVPGSLLALLIIGRGAGTG